MFLNEAISIIKEDKNNLKYLNEYLKLSDGITKTEALELFDVVIYEYNESLKKLDKVVKKLSEAGNVSPETIEKSKAISSKIKDFLNWIKNDKLQKVKDAAVKYKSKAAEFASKKGVKVGGKVALGVGTAAGGYALYKAKKDRKLKLDALANQEK